MSRSLPSPPLCLITDEMRSPADNERTVSAALDAGCRWIQLRHRRLGGRELSAFAHTLRRLTRARSALLTVNERIDVALTASADGVHLPAAGMAPASARRALGPRALLGVSVHSVDEIAALAEAPIDYVQFGPLFETASKRAFGPAQGLDALGAACGASGDRPLVAVGGIAAGSVAAAMHRGAAAVAVIGAVHAADDPATAVRELLSQIKRA